MPDKTYRAATIVTPDISNQLVLEAAFNQWAQEIRPANILHVHYYHDVPSRVQGYQVVYEEAWMPILKADSPPGDTRMLV